VEQPLSDGTHGAYTQPEQERMQPIQQCRLTATNVYPLTPSPQLAMPHAEQRDRRTRSGRAHSGQSQRARCRNHDSMSAEPNGIRPRDPERSKKLGSRVWVVCVSPGTKERMFWGIYGMALTSRRSANPPMTERVLAEWSESHRRVQRCVTILSNSQGSCAGNRTRKSSRAVHPNETAWANV